MTYSVTLERGADGTCLAWVHELPGCFVRGATRSEVERRLPEAIHAFVERFGGEPEAEFEIVAEVESAIEAAEDTEVLLDPDRAPLTQADWDRIEGLLGASRRELFDAFDRLSKEQIVHIGFVELMYAAWTFDRDSREGLRSFLDWTRTVATARMRELAAADDGTVTEAEWAGAPRPEPWTARKAARRLIWHELLHLPDSDG